MKYIFKLKKIDNYVKMIAVQPAEDARANASDKEDRELLKAGVAVEGPGQHLLRADEEAQCLGEQRDD
jgi:hypothetical protein